MGMRGLVFVVALSSPAVTAGAQTSPTSESIAARSQDIVTQAFAPFPLGGRSYSNWSDLPFTISVSQTAGFNDNVLALPQGQQQPVGTPLRGDWFSNTIFGAATKMYVGQQQLFADVNYGFTDYRTDRADNTHQYSLDAGINWGFTSRCSGRLVAAQDEYQTPINQQVGSGINTVLSSSISELATCLLAANGSVLLDSGWSTSQNTGALDAANSYNSVYVRGGVQYSVTGLDTARALITDTKRQFTDRGPALSAVGLASETEQIDYQLLYNRVLSSKLTFDGMIGVSQDMVVSQTQGMRSPTHLAPIYSLSLIWQPTPKLSFGVASSRSVGAPSSTLSNAELATAKSITATYALSPKTSLQWGVSQTTASGGTASSATTPSISSNSSGMQFFCAATYLATPFTTATLSYRHIESASVPLETKDNIYLINVVYAPH